MRFWGTLCALFVFVGGSNGCGPSSQELSERTAINISVPYEVDSFDPHATITISNFAVLSNFYEPLVRTDSMLKIKPCLARSWENPDSRTWIFELQPTARFHSGKPMTAEDVEYSLNRLVTHTELRMRGFLPKISEVTVLSSNKVRVRTEHPVVVFLSKLNFALIIPRGSTPESLAQNIDGTGPYRMNGWKKGEFIRLVRNDEYWGPKPEIQDVLMRLNRTPEEAIRDLESGSSQLVQSNTKQLEDAMFVVNGYEMLSHDSLFAKLLGFDVAGNEIPDCSVKPNPFKNTLVRQAIHLTINRDELISKIPAQATTATQPVPAFIFGFNPTIPQPVYDPNRGLELLKAAGLANGFRVTLHARNILKETAEMIRDQLKALNIQVDVQTLTDEEFFRRLNRRELGFYLTRWGCPSGDASDILEDVFHTEDGRDYGGNNWGRFSDPQIDRSIEESAGVQSVEERQAILQRSMKLLMERLPMIPLYTDLDTYALDRRFSWTPRNDSYILASEIGLRKAK